MYMSSSPPPAGGNHPVFVGDRPVVRLHGRVNQSAAAAGHRHIAAAAADNNIACSVIFMGSNSVDQTVLVMSG